MLPHLDSGYAVDQAILSEEDRVVAIRFGHDWDPVSKTPCGALFVCARIRIFKDPWLQTDSHSILILTLNTQPPVCPSMLPYDFPGVYEDGRDAVPYCGQDQELCCHVSFHLPATCHFHSICAFESSICAFEISLGCGHETSPFACPRVHSPMMSMNSCSL